MTKTKTRLLILTIIFGLLAIVFTLKDDFSALFATKADKPFATFTQDQIQEITIKNDAKTTRIIKNDNNWIVKTASEEAKADQGRIENIISSLNALEKGEVVSSNKAKHAELGIGKKQITLITKDKTTSLYIGDSISVLKSYVRIDDQNEVFITNNLESIFEPDDYRDLRVRFIEDEQQVSYAEIKYDNLNLVFEKKDNQWLVNNKKAKREAVNFYLSDIKTLKAVDMAKVESTQGITIMTIKIKEDNKNKEATFTQKDEENSYLKTSKSETIFVISELTLDTLRREEKDFIE